MFMTRSVAPTLLFAALCFAANAEEKAASTDKPADAAAATDAKSADAKPAEAKSAVTKPMTPKDFTLEDADGTKHTLADLKGKIIVLEWTNSECPFVQRAYKSGVMMKTATKFADKGVVWLAVNSGKV